MFPGTTVINETCLLDKTYDEPSSPSVLEENNKKDSLEVKKKSEKGKVRERNSYGGVSYAQNYSSAGPILSFFKSPSRRNPVQSQKNNVRTTLF